MPVGAEKQFAIGGEGEQAKANDLPVQPEDPAPEWVRPPDFDARMARVTASLPYNGTTFSALSRAEQIAFYQASVDAVRKEFPDMPFGMDQAGQGKGWEGKNWAEVVVDFGAVVKVCAPPPPPCHWQGPGVLGWEIVLMRGINRRWMRKRGRS